MLNLMILQYKIQNTKLNKKLTNYMKIPKVWSTGQSSYQDMKKIDKNQIYVQIRSTGLKLKKITNVINYSKVRSTMKCFINRWKAKFTLNNIKVWLADIKLGKQKLDSKIKGLSNKQKFDR